MLGNALLLTTWGFFKFALFFFFCVRFSMFNLVTKHEYEFRVKAKNAAGFSKPSPPSAQFKAKGTVSPPGPPGTPTVVRVDRYSIKTVI